MDTALARELRRARIAAGLSLRAAQTNTGISNAYLSQLETGKAENPSPTLLQKLATAYGLQSQTLLQLAGYSTQANTRDIFLSHRSKDKVFVRELAGDIEREQHNGRSLSVWLDEAEIRPGESIPAQVNSGLEKSRFIAIVMTPDYFASGSGWTDAEWHAALHTDPDNKRGRILPLLVHDCPFVPYLLRHLKAIDMRGERYMRGLSELVAVLRDEPLQRPVTHRGQLITSGSRIDRSTLVAERTVPDADPDVVTERLYCNLLPVERLPRYVYMAPISSELMKTTAAGKQSVPSKNALKQIIRTTQESEGIEPEQRFMPAFRLFEDRVITLHDLEDPDGPLNAIVEENEIEVIDLETFIRDEDLRKILVSLFNMGLSRHLARAGLVIDDTKNGRFFFPDRNGQPNVITWTPRRKKAVRTVAKPVTKDARILFWRNLGAYLQVIFLVNHFYVKISPTWVITEDGETPSSGPEIGRRVIRWTGPERNMQVLYHVRFWTSVLRRGKGGPISIRVGDQSLEVATVPALIQQSYGISNDQRDLMRMLDEEAPLIAAEEEQDVDSALETDLDESEILEEDEYNEEELDAVISADVENE